MSETEPRRIRYQDLTLELFGELFWPKVDEDANWIACSVCKVVLVDGLDGVSKDRAGRIVHDVGCLERANKELSTLVYFANGEEEHYTCTDPREYVVEVLDTFCPDVPDEIEVLCFKRREVDEEWIESAVWNFLEWWAERFGDEFGPWDDGPTDGSNAAEATELLKKWCARAEVFACEEMPIVIVLDREAINGIGFEEWPEEWGNG